MAVIRINPKSAQAYQYRGRARATKGEFDKALDDYDAAIRQRPWEAEGESADSENALKWAQRAQELSPDETKERLDAFLDLDRERKPFRTTTGE